MTWKLYALEYLFQINESLLYKKPCVQMFIIVLFIMLKTGNRSDAL